jgi:hypothetical protein
MLQLQKVIRPLSLLKKRRKKKKEKKRKNKTKKTARQKTLSYLEPPIRLLLDNAKRRIYNTCHLEHVSKFLQFSSIELTGIQKFIC